MKITESNRRSPPNANWALSCWHKAWSSESVDYSAVSSQPTRRAIAMLSLLTGLLCSQILYSPNWRQQMSPQQYATEVMNLVEKSLEPAASPHRLPQSKEELIQQNRRIAVDTLKAMVERSPQRIQNWLVDVRSLLDLPGVLDGSTAVQCFALLSGLRDALKQIDGLIGNEIDTPSSGRDAGRLHDIVLKHFERTGISQVKCEGRTVHLHSQLWASCLNIEVLRQHDDTAGFVQPKVNGQTLSAYVRELPRDEQGDVMLPEELKEAIQVSDTTQVRTRKR